MTMYFHVNGVEYAKVVDYKYKKGQKHTRVVPTFGGNTLASGRKESDTVFFSFIGLHQEFDGKKCEIVHEDASSFLIEPIDTTFENGVVKMRAIVLGKV